jgi:hypothetical protein
MAYQVATKHHPVMGTADLPEVAVPKKKKKPSKQSLRAARRTLGR